MIRNIPFNIRNNAEKGRESIERMMDYLMEQPLNPIGKVSGAGIAGHIHYHLLPRWGGDTNFMPLIAGTKVISEELETTYERLKKNLKDFSL